MTDAPFDAHAEAAEGLSGAFVLPADIAANANLAELYAEMVTRLRRESSGLPMNTVQQLLIERIASFYVQIKFREHTSSWTGVSQQKEFNVYWLSLTAEFNKLLASNEDKQRDALLIEVQKIVTDAMDLIPDPTVKQDVRRRLAGDFASINL